jgi:hypothetical protein
MIRRDIADEAMVRKRGRIPAFLVPTAIQNPLPLRQGGSKSSNALTNLLRPSGLAELHARKAFPAVVQVHMSVIKAREKAPSGEIDAPRLGSAEGFDFKRRAGGGDAIPNHGNGLNLGLTGIAGPHSSPGQNQVCTGHSVIFQPKAETPDS